MAKELNKRAFIEASKNASKQGLGQAVVKGALYEGYIGAGVGAAQDAMLQNTAIKTGIQTEWDLKQLGISTAAGFGFGTVFGAGFTGAGFKLSTRKTDIGFTLIELMITIVIIALISSIKSNISVSLE